MCIRAVLTKDGYAIHEHRPVAVVTRKAPLQLGEDQPLSIGRKCSEESHMKMEIIEYMGIPPTD